MISISIIIPAFNEEANLPVAIRSALAVVESFPGLEYELLIVNDGSRDGTQKVIDDFASRHPTIRYLRHATNLGIGAAFLSGVASTRFPKVTLFPGDNLVSRETLRELIQNAGRADVVLAYTENVEYRKRFRRTLSFLYTLACRLVFRVPVRYIHATPVYDVAKLRQHVFRCRRYSFPSEVTVKSLRDGSTFLELPGYMNLGKGRSSALRLINVIEVLKTFARLMLDIYVTDRKRYAHFPVRVGAPPELRTCGTSFSSSSVG